MKKTNTQLLQRIVFDWIFKGIILSLSALVLVPLCVILFFIFKNGLPALSFSFFTHLPKPIGMSGGGILNCIIGTFILISLASVMAIPFSIAVGIYLSENATQKGVPSIVRLMIEILQGIPSIVIGIIAYLWVVKPMGKFSALSGSVALAIMMIPVVVRATEESLKMVPDTLKEAALALGVPYYNTILRVIVPTALSGILTGALLGISRIAGETAPLLFTAFGSPFLNTNILKPIASLPLLIFTYAISPYDEWRQMAWGASLVLILMVFILNLGTKVVTRK